jgi:hypothetical protein
MDELFRSAAARSADFPLLGKPGQVAGHARVGRAESYR